MKADSEGAAACGAELFSCMQGRYDCREDLEAKVLELIMQLEYRICAKDGTCLLYTSEYLQEGHANSYYSVDLQFVTKENVD